MVKTTQQKIQSETRKTQCKIYALKQRMKLKQKKAIGKSQENALLEVDKIIERLKKDQDRKIKDIEEKSRKIIKNLEREEKGNKKVEYKKKVSWSKEFEKLLTLIQKKRRLECSDEKGYSKCYTCDNIRHRKGMHGGHFITRAKKNTARQDINIHSQCPSCNAFHYGRPLEYKEQFLKDYGEKEYNRLILESNKAINKSKYGLDWISKKAKETKNKIKELLKER